MIPPSSVVYLGEGHTPLVRACAKLRDDVGLEFSFKNDGQNPSASFKDRGMATALSFLNYMIQEKGVEWFTKCIELEEKYDYYFYKGMCLFFTEQTSDAKEAFTRAAELTEDPEQNQMVRQVMEYIESQE